MVTIVVSILFMLAVFSFLIRLTFHLLTGTPASNHGLVVGESYYLNGDNPFITQYVTIRDISMSDSGVSWVKYSFFNMINGKFVELGEPNSMETEAFFRLYGNQPLVTE